jgi:hypothetical protein
MHTTLERKTQMARIIMICLGELAMDASAVVEYMHGQSIHGFLPFHLSSTCHVLYSSRHCFSVEVRSSAATYSMALGSASLVMWAPALSYVQ